MDTGKEVLIIENRANPNPEIHLWVKSMGWQKVIKGNGIEALMWLGRGNIPHLIFAEAEMGMMTGMQFVEYLKASGFFHDVPVIAFGHPQSREALAAMMQAGADEYLVKPVTSAQIDSKVSRIFLNQHVA